MSLPQSVKQNTKSTRRLTSLIAAGGILLLAVQNSWAQDLKPGIRFTGDPSGNWSADDSWTVAGSDPAEPGVPGEGEIVSVRNGGTAQVTSAVPNVDALSIRNGTVDLGQGGSLTIAGPTAIGGNGALVVGGNGAIETTSLASDGNISINSKDANVNVSGDFANNGTISLNTTGADPYGIINVGGHASLGGGSIDLATTPTGASMSFGSSWGFLKSSGVSGQPSSITVGGSAPALDRGLGLQVATDGDGNSSVTVGSVPIAIVDRASGNISVNNVVGGALDITGYTLSSEGGLLSADGWSSLSDQGSEGWAEASPTANQLTELNLLGSSTLDVGGTADLGGAWGGTNKAPRDEDLEFSISLADGRVLQGAVEYSGPANDLVLAINPETGEGTLQNMSASIGDFDLVGYNITSSSGSLDVAGFSGLGDAGFRKANPTETALAEISLEASKVFGNGTSVSLGNIFKTDGAQDLVLSFGTSDFGLHKGTVEYGSGGGSGPVCDPNTQGDLDGNGTVEFADFLVLSANFGSAVAGHAQGDIDCNGAVEFADFLVLSANFGSAVGAESASVPEPSTGILGLLAILGLLKFRKRAHVVCLLLLGMGLLSMPQTAMAEDFDTRFIRLHPEGPNAQINSADEALGILNGSVLNVIKNEDLTGKLDIIDLLGGGTQQFPVDNPYLNGVDNGDMDDFLQHVSATIEIPAGDWTIGFGSDDGGWLSLPGVTFIDTYNENGPAVDGDGELLFNGTRGHDWTMATFTVPAGGITTGFEALFFERGGGDSFEVGIFDEHIDPDIDPINNGDNRRNTAALLFLELEDGTLDWNVTGDPFSGAGLPGDFNGDDTVDMADFTILAAGFPDGPGGDMDGNGTVDLNDFVAFRAAFPQPAGAATSSVPEPGSGSLILIAAMMLFGKARRRVRR